MSHDSAIHKKILRGPLRHYSMAIALLLSANCAFAQASSTPDEESSTVIHASSELVLLDALVENRKTGEVIGPFVRDDFNIYEDGVQQKISYFSHDQLPLSVVFLFDLTETVRPILKPLAEAAHEVLGHLKPEDEAAIMVFSSHTELLQDFTTDRSLVASAMEKASTMKSGDGTFIHEDMFEAVQRASEHPAPGRRRVLIWLTDGTSNYENALTQKTIGKSAPAHLHTKVDAIAELRHSDIVVSALIDRSAKTDALMTVSAVNPFSFIAGGRIGDIRKYADMTGGPVLNTSKTDAAARLDLLIDQIRARYTLGYRPSTESNAKEGGFHSLRVALSPSSYKEHAALARGDIAVRTKSGYFR